MIEADLLNRDGEIWVREHGDEMRGTEWLLKRVARLPILADRILMAVEMAPHFISPCATLSDQLDEAHDSGVQIIGAACDLALDILGRKPVGSSNVVYLTSDAGEGKTTIINHLARVQADRFKKRETDWLLVPIALGGKPFLRFDDLVVGFMSNRLRFPMFYFDGFMELVKLGVIVPAFDGFEEMFVQNASGDALSAVGNLMRSLDSNGTVLIAARKAYFDYQDIRMQARLYDSIGTCSVVFSRVSLKRWEKAQFLEYCEKRNIENGDEIHRQVAQRLKNDKHPLLTRAVLVKRLLTVAEGDGGIAELLVQLGNSPTDYFAVFVNAIIEREAHEKWIHTSGDAAKPLLSVQEHIDLLSNIAQEMWLLSTEFVKVDVLDAISELFCESRRLVPTVTAQIKERIKQHALIVGSGGSQQTFAFDHEEFRNFFLGEALGRLCIQLNPRFRVELLTMLRKGSLPLQASDAAVAAIRRMKDVNFDQIARLLQELATADGSSSFTQENVARLVLKVLHNVVHEPIVLSNLTFDEDALRDLSLKNITFDDCRFASMSLDNAKLEECHFINCHFDRLNLKPSITIRKCSISGGDITCVQPADKNEAVFVPALIPALLRTIGFEMPVTSLEKGTVSVVEEDLNIKLFRKLVYSFTLKTFMNDKEVVQKLGASASAFIKNEVPRLIKAGVLIKEYNELVKQDRYHLATSMENITEVFHQAPKSIEEFIKIFADDRS